MKLKAEPQICDILDNDKYFLFMYNSGHQGLPT